MVDIFEQEYDDAEIEIKKNLIVKGEEINLMQKDPTMQRLVVGAGWELNAFDTDPLDLDISCFMLNREGKTRVNEDFVFYNNFEGSDKAVIHNGDNRTGAGDGDDETITVDLNAIHFDIVELMFVLSIYKGEEKGQSLSKVRNGYIRIVNLDNSMEIIRYELDDDVAGHSETTMLVAKLTREGPKWHFTAIGECVDGGLQKVATDYDIIVGSA